MKSAIAIRHLAFEDLGSLEPFLIARGYTVRYLDATADDLRDEDIATSDLLVVLGGPIGAFDEALYPFLSDELAVVLQRLESRRPLLGICLGAQLIARALGVGVTSMGVKEIGFSALALTKEGDASPLAALLHARPARTRQVRTSNARHHRVGGTARFLPIARCAIRLGAG